MAKHRMDTRRTRLTRVSRRMAVGAGMVCGGVVIAVLATGGTYALLNAKTPVSAGTVQAGTAGLTVNGAASYAIPGLDTTTLYAGRSVITPTPLVLKNTGTTPLAVTQGSVTFTTPGSALAPWLTVALEHSTTCTPSDGTPTPFATFTLAAGASASICVEVQLSAAAPSAVQGLSLGFTAPISAVQVRQ